MEGTWTNRDLLVLQAVVKIFNQTGQTRIGIEQIQQETGFEKSTTQRALQMLYREPYFDEGDIRSYSGGYLAVGAPTSAALRLAGAWPTPENLHDRLIAAFKAAGEDEHREEPERSKFKQAAVWLGSFGSQVAIGALGGAGGHILST
jgi:hypothetical protein